MEEIILLGVVKNRLAQNWIEKLNIVYYKGQYSDALIRAYKDTFTYD